MYKNAYRIMLGATLITVVGCTSTSRSQPTDSGKPEIVRQSAQTPLEPAPDPSAAFYLLKRPDDRVNDQPEYFKHEHVRISDRRKQKPMDSAGHARPDKILGLGLSGGGIRSAAYQLGLLSGLNAANLMASGNPGRELSVLDRVDYLSCASGGCWATGAFVIADEPVDTYFGCLDEQALKGTVSEPAQCGRAKNILRNEQKVILTREAKEHWELDIRKAYLPDNCQEFQFTQRDSACLKNLDGKPYPIFNLTHDTQWFKRWGANISNLPFQITPDELGTIVDCGSEGLGKQGCRFIKRNLSGKGKPGFFVRYDARDYEWSRRERSLGTGFLKVTTTPGSHFSKAMAHSSAVAGSPKALEFSMGLTHNGKSIPQLRESYQLEDGGWVENLGLLSLVERGAELIVLSDMGYPERLGDDVAMAKNQVEKLLKCQVTVPEKFSESDLISTFQYTCPNIAEAKGTRSGTIIYVRPYPENISDFKRDLKASQIELYECIEDKTQQCYGDKWGPDSRGKDAKAPLDPKYQFPRTATMLMVYDPRLIRAYYLLGKFIGEHHVAPKVQAWLQLGTSS